MTVDFYNINLSQHWINSLAFISTNSNQKSIKVVHDSDIGVSSYLYLKVLEIAGVIPLHVCTISLWKSYRYLIENRRIVCWDYLLCFLVLFNGTQLLAIECVICEMAQDFKIQQATKFLHWGDWNYLPILSYSTN